MSMAVHYSSQTDQWETPADFYGPLHQEFGFSLDVCAIPSNAKCPHYITPEEDGLSQNWAARIGSLGRGAAWCNPPYGREIGKWIRKAYEEAKKGITVVCLIPARTDTAWWHDYVMRASEIRLVRGRLKFGASNNPAPFPSAVVIFNPASLDRWPKLT